jgi:hypothetical protein
MRCELFVTVVPAVVSVGGKCSHVSSVSDSCTQDLHFPVYILNRRQMALISHLFHGQVICCHDSNLQVGFSCPCCLHIRPVRDETFVQTSNHSPKYSTTLLVAHNLCWRCIIERRLRFS